MNLPTGAVRIVDCFICQNHRPGRMCLPSRNGDLCYLTYEYLVHSSSATAAAAAGALTGPCACQCMYVRYRRSSGTTMVFSVQQLIKAFSTQKLWINKCATQNLAWTCIVDAVAQGYTDPTLPWEVTPARSSGHALESRASRYCRLSKRRCAGTRKGCSCGRLSPLYPSSHCLKGAV